MKPANEKITSPEAYIAALEGDRKVAIQQLRETLRANLPAGFQETIQYGMISYVVPLSLYPKGYLNDPRTPLPFISLASHKNHIAVYHMGLYALEQLLDWFVKEYSLRAATKLDMGKSCIRFKKTETIPYELIAELAGKISPEQWVERYKQITAKH